MLSLDDKIQIPKNVSSTVVEQGAVLLNLSTGKYFALRDVGLRFWELLKGGEQLRDAHQALLAEYDVASEQLEQDLVELLNQLYENGLVELISS